MYQKPEYWPSAQGIFRIQHQIIQNTMEPPVLTHIDYIKPYNMIEHHCCKYIALSI